MTRRAYLIYAMAAMMTVVSYTTMRSYLIRWPNYAVVISNLTLAYVLLSFISGGAAGWYLWNSTFRRRSPLVRFAGTTVGAFLAAVVWLVLVSLGGYHIRFMS